MMPPTMQAFQQQFELFLEAVAAGKDPDVRQLRDAALAHMKRGALARSEIAPCLAVLWFYVFEYEGRSWYLRLYMKALVWASRNIFYRNRPMWNDFWMGLWMLSRNPRYVGKLYWHLRRANEKKIVAQAATGDWMVNSVCQQDPVFREHWMDAIAERGDFSSGEAMQQFIQGGIR